MEEGRVAVLGRGAKAVAIAAWFAQNGYSLEAVVKVENEPDWDLKIREELRAHWLVDVPVIDSHEGLEGEWDVIFSCFYDRILPAELLDRVRLPLNLHPAPLPKYRGVRPINWALKNGEKEHGLAIHRMTPGIDDGPVYGRITFPIWPEIDEVRDVYNRMLALVWPLFLEVMPRVDDIAPWPQDETEASVHYSSQNDDLGERSDWTREISA